MKKQIDIDECGGKLLTEVLKNSADDVLLFVFEDCFSIIEASGEEDEAYLNDVHSCAVDIAARFGFKPKELLRVGVIDQDCFGKIMELRKKNEGDKLEAKRQEYLKLKQEFEPESAQ